MKMCGARWSGPAYDILKMDGYSIRVSDGHIKDPFDGVAHIVVHYHLMFALVKVVICWNNAFNYVSFLNFK